MPQAKFLGPRVPDPLLRWNEAEQRHEFGAIDWSEFERVLKGNGPCNAERLAARRACVAAGRLGARSGERLRGEAAPPCRELRGMSDAQPVPGSGREHGPTG